MTKNQILLAVGALCTGAVAQAYEISHSYTAEGGAATEFHGKCNTGDHIVIVKAVTGDFSYQGPRGEGQLGSPSSIDDAARAACGE